MKFFVLGMALLMTMPSFASQEFVGEYELKSGNSSCERNVSVINVDNGLRFVSTNDIGTMFEHENADDFLNINGNRTVTSGHNSSHGTKYISETVATFDGGVLTSVESFKEYNFGVRTSKTEIKVVLTLKDETLSYVKSLKGRNNWTRNCLYQILK